MAEIRNLPEGTLSWVQSSGTGGWGTGATPASGVMGFVQAGMSFQQPQTFTPYYNRGTAGGFKFVQKQAGTLTFKLAYGITADYPPTATTAVGVSTPQIHFEFKAASPENNVTGLYWRFHNCVNGGPKITEGAAQDEADFSFQFLTYSGVNASGMLS